MWLGGMICAKRVQVFTRMLLPYKLEHLLADHKGGALQGGEMMKRQALTALLGPTPVCGLSVVHKVEVAGNAAEL
jgi:hypothetical protein